MNQCTELLFSHLNLSYTDPPRSSDYKQPTKGKENIALAKTSRLPHTFLLMLQAIYTLNVFEHNIFRTCVK